MPPLDGVSNRFEIGFIKEIKNPRNSSQIQDSFYAWVTDYWAGQARGWITLSWYKSGFETIVFLNWYEASYKSFFETVLAFSREGSLEIPAASLLRYELVRSFVHERAFFHRRVYHDI